MPRPVVSSALIAFLVAFQEPHVGDDYGTARRPGEHPPLAVRRGTPRTAVQPAISSSNGTVFGVTFARSSTWLATLFSTTTASTSAMRCRSLRYQRITWPGF